MNTSIFLFLRSILNISTFLVSNSVLNISTFLFPHFYFHTPHWSFQNWSHSLVGGVAGGKNGETNVANKTSVKSDKLRKTLDSYTSLSPTHCLDMVKGWVYQYHLQGIPPSEVCNTPTPRLRFGLDICASNTYESPICICRLGSHRLGARVCGCHA